MTDATEIAIGQFGLPVMRPERAPELEPYWTATAQGRLVLPHCDGCGFVVWYPRTFCPACHCDAVSWIDSPGTGTVYSHTTTRHGPGRYRSVDRYVLAYVDLDEGPRVLTNVVGCRPQAVHIGQRVRAVFDPVDDECGLLRFEPLDIDQAEANPAAPTTGKDWT